MPADLSKVVTAADTFSICAPDGFSAHWEDGRSTFVLNVGNEIRPLYIRQYRLKKAHTTEEALERELYAHCVRFVKTGMSDELGETPKHSIESGRIDGMLYSQAVAQIAVFEWWIARIVSQRKYPDYFLVHWIGNRSDLSLGLSILTSFEILPAENRVKKV